MSNVKWLGIENRIESIDDVVVPAKNIIEADWNKESHIVCAEAENKEIIDFDLSGMFSPILGNYWRVLYKEGDFDGIRDAILRYWKYKDAPTVKAKIIKFAGETPSAVLGTKVTAEKDRDKKKYDANEILKGINDSFDYDRVVVGSNSENVELQFLNSKNRIDASRDPQVNDYLDPGLFVFLNGNVQVSAGCNRLICTNGLTEHLNVFESRDYKFDKEIMDRAITLANWLVTKQDAKVCSVRELSVILNGYPKPMATKFWKEWSQKIETKELTWFEVINDITNYANKYMDKTRQHLIQFPETLRQYERDATCPVCSTHIE